MANACYTAGKADKAEQTYREALDIDPRLLVARNNLAHLLAERGCGRRALPHVDLALSALTDDSELEDEVFPEQPDQPSDSAL